MTTSRPTHLDSFNSFIQKKINAAVRTVLHKTKATIQELQNEIKSKDLLIQDLEQIIRTQEHRERALREQDQRQQEHRERALREQEQRQQDHRERELCQHEQEKRECAHRDQSERDRPEHCVRAYHEQRELETRERFQLEHFERVFHEELEREARELERRDLEQQKLATQFREWVLSNEDIPLLKQQELLHQENCAREYRQHARVGRAHENRQQDPHIYRKKGNQLKKIANKGSRSNSSVEFNHKMSRIKSNGGQHARGGIVPPEDNSSNHIL